MPREGSEPPGTPRGGAAGDSIERAASDLARYALACNAAGKPMRREGIRDTVMSGNGARNLKTVLERSSQLLEQTMGLKIVPLPPHEKTLLPDAAAAAATQTQTTTAKTTTTNKWVLVSTLPDATRRRLRLAQNDRAITGFAATVLSLIFVNNMSVPSDQLALYVRKLGPPDAVLASTDSSSRNGSDAQMESAAREAIDYLTRAGFLDKVQQIHDTPETQQHNTASNDHPAADYTWGPTARTRFTPLDMARFVAAMTGEECSPAFIKTIGRAYGHTIPLSS
ncbi:hypothetical protein EV175_001144 [Coemansia sp. RSA 1933]|nr:hypothetical protein EV175_001144 [Coemansia sp. RSA 1933]